MLERTDAITNEVLEPITFVLAYRTVFPWNLRGGRKRIRVRIAPVEIRTRHTQLPLHWNVQRAVVMVSLSR